MSNNPLEAVTQAVNSLVTALKLPDESAKANEVLGEMSFPQFSRLLPYRDYNQESGLFMNDTTMGFMLEAIPINGANTPVVMDDGKRPWRRFFQRVQPFRFLCYQPDCQCGR